MFLVSCNVINFSTTQAPACFSSSCCCPKPALTLSLGVGVEAGVLCAYPLKAIHINLNTDDNIYNKHERPKISLLFFCQKTKHPSVNKERLEEFYCYISMVWHHNVWSAPVASSLHINNRCKGTLWQQDAFLIAQLQSCGMWAYCKKKKAKIYNKTAHSCPFPGWIILWLQASRTRYYILSRRGCWVCVKLGKKNQKTHTELVQHDLIFF